MAAKPVQIDTSNIEIIDEPSSFKWLLGLSAACAVGGILYGLDLFGSSLHYLRLHDNLRLSLTNATSISEVLTDETYSRLLASRDNQLRALHSVHGFVDKQEYGRAIAGSEHPSLQNLPSQVALKKSIEDIRTATLHRASSEQSMEEANQMIAGLKSQHAIAASRFARSLQLYDLADQLQERAAQAASGEVVVIDPNFYANGVLAGLPVLEGIPDGVAEFRDVAKFLQTANAQVIARNLNWSKSEVRLELANLQADSQQLVSLLEDAENSIVLAKHQEQAADQSLQDAQVMLRKASSELILELATPQLSERALIVYAFVREQSKGFLGDLPSPNKTS